MELKDKQKQEAEEGKEPTPPATPDKLQNEKLAQLASELGIKPEELENAQNYSKRAKDVERGFSKRFSQKENELKRKEEELNRKEEELNNAKLGKDTPAEDIDTIKTKLTNGDIDVDEAIEKIVTAVKPKTDDISTTAAKAAKAAIEEYKQELLEAETTKQQERAISGIALKLANKHGCKEAFAKAIFKSALEETGDPTVAIKETDDFLGNTKPQKTEEAPKGKQPAIPLKPNGPKHNTTGAATDNDLIRDIASKMG